ncbi:hypothetical protein HID58_092565 [Brassica napus]|uniref:Uncharacterized protein n=1 Tax=Brassica napus TaxID=3708 RepID=A0ABQ7WW55_BRANA|nr:hypothetical protein HID58_092565 [Brassica napus]
MVASKIVTRFREDLLIPDMMFAHEKNPSALRAINFILNALLEDEIQKIRESAFRKIVEIADKPLMKDEKIRFKISCLAIVFAVLLSMNLNMKIAREQAEAIEDLDDFF